MLLLLMDVSVDGASHGPHHNPRVGGSSPSSAIDLQGLTRFSDPDEILVSSCCRISRTIMAVSPYLKIRPLAYHRESLEYFWIPQSPITAGVQDHRSWLIIGSVHSTKRNFHVRAEGYS